MQEQIAELHAVLGQLAARSRALTAACDERVSHLQTEYAEAVREFKERLELDIRTKLAAKAKRLFEQAPTLDIK